MAFRGLGHLVRTPSPPPALFPLGWPHPETDFLCSDHDGYTQAPGVYLSNLSINSSGTGKAPYYSSQTPRKGSHWLVWVTCPFLSQEFHHRPEEGMLWPQLGHGPTMAIPGPHLPYGLKTGEGSEFTGKTVVLLYKRKEGWTGEWIKAMDTQYGPMRLVL